MFTPLDSPDMALPLELFGPLYDILLIIFDYFMAGWPTSDRLVCLLADGRGSGSNARLVSRLLCHLAGPLQSYELASRGRHNKKPLPTVCG